MSITLFNATPAFEAIHEDECYIGRIMTMLEGEKMEAQLCVLSYKVDLYLPRWKLAIECDANKRDVGRQAEIKSVLGCRFIHFNSRDFDFYQVLGRIWRKFRSHHEDACTLEERKKASYKRKLSHDDSAPPSKKLCVENL